MCGARALAECLALLPSGAEHLPRPLRRRKAEAQAAQPLARGIAQSEVWDELREKSIQMQVSSSTGASSDLYRAYERDLRALEDAFPAQPGQCGAALGIGSDLCLDLVSRPDAFARLWPKLRAGYLLDVLERLDRKPTSPALIEGLLGDAGRAELSRQPSAGLGEDVRLRDAMLIGSGLELEGELIQLSAFRSKDGGRRAFGRIARPSRRRASRPRPGTLRRERPWFSGPFCQAERVRIRR